MMTETLDVKHSETQFEPRLIWPGQIIGAGAVADTLGCTRSTVARMVADGRLTPLAQLDGPTGAYVFDRSDLPKTQGTDA